MHARAGLFWGIFSINLCSELGQKVSEPPWSFPYVGQRLPDRTAEHRGGVLSRAGDGAERGAHWWGGISAPLKALSPGEGRWLHPHWAFCGSSPARSSPAGAVHPAGDPILPAQTSDGGG